MVHAAFDFPPDMVAEGEAAAHGMTLASGGAAFELPAGLAYPGLLQDGAC